MRILSHKKITEYSNFHQDAKTALEEWYIKTKKRNWNCFADIKQTFNSADSIGNKRYVFNIKGNSYRLIAMIVFPTKIVYIRFIGTHAEYDKIIDCSIV